MSLVPNCAFPQPRLPPVPVAAQAPALAPVQGDHVFGDVIGALTTGMMGIFGGGQNWRTRQRNYSPMLDVLWGGFVSVNLGHAGAGIAAQRHGAAEPDRHAHMFGGYAERLQWRMCEIVCAGFNPPPVGGENRRIAGATPAWKRACLSALDDLLGVLVDSTALGFYLATPNAIRDADHLAVDHAPMRLADATTTVTNGAGRPGQPLLTPIIANFGRVRNSVSGMLDRFQVTLRTLNPANDAWA
jgi:hypothetical protein